MPLPSSRVLRPLSSRSRPEASTSAARKKIYRLLRDYASDGHAVLLYCTEVPEVFDIADKVYVVSDGRVTEPLQVADHPDVKALAAAITRRERHQAVRPVA